MSPSGDCNFIIIMYDLLAARETRRSRRTAICIHLLLLCKFIELERLKEVSNYTVLVVLYVFCNYQLDVVTCLTLCVLRM